MSIEKPKLYKRGVDQVLLEDFIRNSEENFNSSFNSLDYSNEQKEQIRNAYNEMMGRFAEGDGSMVSKFGGGFTDLKSQFSNKPDKKDFDPYGIATYFIDNSLRNTAKYEEPKKPSNKIKWNDRAFAKALNKQVYGGDDQNIEYFVNLDPYDKKSKKRSQANRINAYVSGLNHLEQNLQNVFEDLTPEQEQEAKNNIASLRTVFQDGIVGENEYLALYKILGDQKYKQMFSQDKDIPVISNGSSSNDQAQPAVKVDNTRFDYGNSSIDRNAIAAWTQANYPRPSEEVLNKAFNITSSNYGVDAIKKTNQALSKLSTDALQKLVYTGVMKGQDVNLNLISEFYTAMGEKSLNLENNFIVSSALNLLKGQNQLGDLGNGYYYLPNFKTKNKSIAYVWDSNNNTIIRKYIAEIDPHRLISEFQSANSIQYNGQQIDPNYMQYYTSLKRGGIIKAQDGIEINEDDESPLKKKEFSLNDAFDDIWDAVTFEDVEGTTRYKYDYNPSTGKYELLSRISGATNNRTYEGDTKYDIEPGNGSDIESKSYWEGWKKQLTSNEKLAERWARDYRKLQVPGMPHSNEWFDENDKFNFENFKKSTLWSDGKAGIGHDVYKGRTYAIKTEDGKVKYTSSVPDGYMLRDGAPKYTEDGLIAIYEILKKSTPKPEEKESTEQESQINPVDANLKEHKIGNLNKLKAERAFNNLSELGLVNYINGQNNKVIDILTTKEYPYKQAVQKFSHQNIDEKTAQETEKTGLEALNRVVMGTDVMSNNASMFKAFDVYSQHVNSANGIRTKSRKESLDFQTKLNHENIKSLVDTRNTNADISYKINEDNAKKKATGIQRNSTNWADAISKQINSWNTRIDENEYNYKQYLGELASIKYMPEYDEYQQIAKKISDWTTAHPGEDITKESWYNDAEARSKELEERMNYRKIINTQNIYGYSYVDPYGGRKPYLIKPYFKRNWT